MKEEEIRTLEVRLRKSMAFNILTMASEQIVREYADKCDFDGITYQEHFKMHKALLTLLHAMQHLGGGRVFK